MVSNFSLFLALRYLKPKRTFLSIITLISVIGVMLGVMVLILVLSVMTGFQRELERKVLGFDPHVVVSNGGVLAGWESMAEKIAKLPNVEAVAPYVQGPVIVQHGNLRLAPKIRGIDPELEMKVSDISNTVSGLSKDGEIKKGEIDLDGDKAILGSELAAALGVSIGDKVTVYSPKNIGEALDEMDRLEKTEGKKDLSALKQLILPLELEVSGIFESGRYIYDSEFLLVPLHIGQEIYNLGPDVHGLSIRTADPYHAEVVSNELRHGVIPRSVSAMTWMDINKQFFDAIRMERSVMFFLLMFIILVAAFGIMNTLITVTVQKTREIGIMKALGAGTVQIVGVFVMQGIVVGAFGTLFGLASGMFLVQYRNQVRDWLASVLHVEVFPASVYQFSEIPAEVVPSDVMAICLSAFLICSIAALIPAVFAARLDPVKALRFD